MPRRGHIKESNDSTRCSRNPQNYRECEAQYPYSAQPASSEPRDRLPVTGPFRRRGASDPHVIGPQGRVASQRPEPLDDFT